jgi:hypothetical protein
MDRIMSNSKTFWRKVWMSHLLIAVPLAWLWVGLCANASAIQISVDIDANPASPSGPLTTQAGFTSWNLSTPFDGISTTINGITFSIFGTGPTLSRLRGTGGGGTYNNVATDFVFSTGNGTPSVSPLALRINGLAVGLYAVTSFHFDQTSYGSTNVGVRNQGDATTQSLLTNKLWRDSDGHVVPLSYDISVTAPAQSKELVFSTGLGGGLLNVVRLNGFTITSIDTDFNSDTHTNLTDLDIIRTNYLTGTTHSEGDANLDGIVNQKDFFYWRTNFLAGGGSAASINWSGVPEPSTLALLLGSTLLLCRRTRRRAASVCVLVLLLLCTTGPAWGQVLLNDNFDDGDLATNTGGTGTGWTTYVQGTGSLTETGGEAVFNLPKNSLQSLYSNDSLDLFTASRTTTTFHVSGSSTTNSLPFDLQYGGANGRIWFGLVTDIASTFTYALPNFSTTDRHGLWVSLVDTIDDPPPFNQATLGGGTNPNDYNGQLGWVAADGTRTILAQFEYDRYLMSDPAHNKIDVNMTVTDTSYGISFGGTEHAIILRNGALSGLLPSAPSGQFKLAATIQDGGQLDLSTLKLDRVNVSTGTPRFDDLVLVVDPVTGAATVQNQSTHSIEFISYNINSLSGALLATYSGSGRSNWFPANLSANNLSEVSSNSSITLGVGGEVGLGTAWSSTGLEDLMFTYQTTNGASNQGTVYFGEKPIITLAGDWNGDGHVNSGDYVTWRKNPGAFPANAYDVWRQNFNNPPGAGSSNGLGAAQVPEPCSMLLLTLAVAECAIIRSRKRD